MTASQHTARLWQSHLDARASGMMPQDPAPTTARGRQLCKAALEQARAISAKGTRPAPSRQPVQLSSWANTSPEYRTMLAHMAQLPKDVAAKLDRDLTETEKAMLRAAAQRVAQGIGGLAASL